MKTEQNNLYLHVDGDSFFVACELTTHPELRGKPVIVGGDRGIAVAMSSEAKTIGIHRGMPVFKIKRLFPQVTILSHHFSLYKEIASKLEDILLSYSNSVEVYSIDECFALIEPHQIDYFGGEEKFLTALKKEVDEKLNVSYSYGLATTKALAKQASKLNKPGGKVVVRNKEEQVNVLKKTPIEEVWGIGWRSQPKFKALGVNTAYDFVTYPDKEIERRFSRPMMELKKELSGENIFKVESDTDPRDQKSIQSTATFRPSSTDIKVISREMSENAENACENARELRLLSNKISFFVKTSEFKYRFAEAKLDSYTSDPGEVLSVILPALPKLLSKREKIRSTGVVLHNLVKEESVPMDLFGRQEKTFKKLVVEKAADKIRAKYGHDAIKRASSLKNKI